MTKIRILLLLLTFFVVGSIGTLFFLYAQGYRLNRQTLSFSPNGLLVIKSHPDGAQVFVNGELETATNATVPIPPGTYDISVKKEGYLSWNKRLTIEKEVVTEATAHLFRVAPSLSATTFSGVSNPSPSPDMTKISYIVPLAGNQNSEGLWVIDTINLPLGFSRDPKRITDGNLESSTWVWSPDASEILLTSPTGDFLLDTSKFTSQAQRTNVVANRTVILANWEEKRKEKLEAKVRQLPDDLQEVLNRKTSQILFSPDQDMIVYTASGSATIPEKLIRELPGASTQSQQRDIKQGQTYLYDIKEDRNFFITDEEVDFTGLIPNYVRLNKLGDWKLLARRSLGVGGEIGNSMRSLAWYTSSRHLILAEDAKITILDYDGTNRQIVYSGSYVTPYALPTLSLDRLLILTNLGANSSLPNLYSLSIK
ncbi:hypothetical protein A2714_03280 [Candidatus Woesebacteria bacterium RIFCSPHIGHO2_01_FULL_38_9]|uniref:PEGA domain-containing protein n=2 Tax=Candidatus Woeseibacteriota TaxID=1752722 RepID=A0A1F7Y3P5_9BACT|nr:MAG: hypothetical protein A2714_03280 [Candidatus Woesebacteria bacterium RIFCSPHIGHO2_01_FULL_38_9]OGM61054.1 MAG: hypothetical protein A3A75_02730 [Candidatus Woesebacteria bacterium RIFCSPLOWO2_01_FULL_39_10]